MKNKITVEILISFLLIIAVYGNMGDSDLPDLMRDWAQRLCRENGLNSEMRKLQDERLRNLESRIRNTLGDDMIDEIHQSIEKAVSTIKKLHKNDNF